MKAQAKRSAAHDDGRTAPAGGSDRPAGGPPQAGSKPLTGDRTCRRCDGGGRLYLNGDFELESKRCPKCRGTGVEPVSSEATERLAVPTARPINPIAEGVARRAGRRRARWQDELTIDEWAAIYRTIEAFKEMALRRMKRAARNGPEGGRNTKLRHPATTTECPPKET